MWSPDELAQFLKSIGGHELEPLTRVAAMCGLRRGEAIGLFWDAVDLDSADVQIWRRLTVSRSKPVVGGLKYVVE